MEDNQPLERIYSSAIWYKELPYNDRNPVNIKYGLVVKGHRHGDVIYNLFVLKGLRSVENGPNSVGKYEQGFVTNTDRFVSRIEAAEIAFHAKQIKERTDHPSGLYSEDLW